MILETIVTTVDGAEVHSPRKLYALLQNAPIGKEIAIELKRGSETRSIRLKVGSA